MSKHEIQQALSDLSLVKDSIRGALFDLRNADVPNLDQVAEAIDNVMSAAQDLPDINNYSLELPSETDLVDANEKLDEIEERLEQLLSESSQDADRLFATNVVDIVRNAEYISNDVLAQFFAEFDKNKSYPAFQRQAFYDAIKSFIYRLANANAKAVQEAIYAYLNNLESVEPRIPVVEVTTQSEIERSERNK